MVRFTTLVLLLLACTVTQQARGQTGWGIDSYEGFKASLNNQGTVSQIGWTTGNLGNSWQEGDWVPYLITLKNVDMSTLNFTPIRIKYDFTSGNTDSRFVDLVRNLQVGYTGLAYYPLGVGTTSDYGWPTAAGTPYPLTTAAQLTTAQNNQYEYVWGSGTTAWKLLDLPNNQVNRDLTTSPDPYGGIGTATDSERSFTITRADLIAAGVSATYTGTLQVYFNLHLSTTFVWSFSLQSQFDAPPTDDWGGYLYGISPFSTDTRNGSGYVTGSSGHTTILGQGGRTVPIPVPPAAIGEITGAKFFDANANGVRDAGESGLPGWRIYISAIIGGIPIYYTRTTDNTGSYNLTGLPGGVFYISEEWQGPTPTASPPSNYPYAAFAQYTGQTPSPSTWDQSYPTLLTSINGGAATCQATPAAGLALGYSPESWVVDLLMTPVQTGVNFGNFVPAPQCVVTPSVATICSGATTTFTAARTAQGTPPYTVSWTGPAGWTAPAPSQSLSLTLTGGTAPAGIYTAVLTDANGLSSQGCSATLALHPQPTCSIAPAPQLDVCEGSQTVFTGPAANATTNVVSWSWSISGNATISGSTTGQSITVVAGSYPLGNSFVVTLTTKSSVASGECENTCSYTYGVTPMITCPVNLTVDCASAVPAPDITAVTMNCANVQVAFVGDVISNQTGPNCYTITRTYSGTTGLLTVQCEQIITVNDDEAPIITTLAGALDATLECSDAAGITAALALYPAATDNCAAVPTMNLVSDVTTPGATCTNAYVRVRTWNFDDGCGNVCANFVQTITVQDNTPPVVTTVAGALDATLECSDAAGITAALALYPVATDNCAAVPAMTLVSDVTTPSATCANAYVRVRTWSFDDGCGNVCATHFVQTITVEDNTAPVITTLAGALDVTLDCANLTGITAASAMVPTATDNCMAVPNLNLISDVTTPHATCANAYVQVRTWNFDDGCGNVSANFVQTITVEDNTPPVITTLPGALDVTIECTNPTGITAALALYPAATDNCSAVPTMTLVSDVTTPSTICANSYVQVRTWSFYDGCGNVCPTLYVQTITVQDNTPPVVTTLAGALDATLECSDAAGITAALALYPAATDNCTAVPTMHLVSDVTTPSATCANAYVQVRTWNFDDGCGNVSANYVQTITVEDNTAPVVTTLAGSFDVTLDCSNTAGITAALALFPAATDNCTAVPTMTLVSDVTTPHATCTNAYVQVRTWNFDDGCGNVSANFVQTITVEDNTPPVITTVAGALDATLECSDLAGITAALALYPAATDNCTAVPTMTLVSDVTTPSATCANAYVQVRTWSFDDGCGNVCPTLFVQTITVEDNTAPVITTLAGALDATLECSDLTGIAAAVAMVPVATDNCTAIPTMHLVSDVTTPHATCANAYVQVRTWNFDDGCGNVSANFVQTITVEDNTPPVITTLPGALDITIECTNATGITAALALYPAATDNCSSVPTMTLVSNVTTPSTTCANSYVQVRTWSFYDGCGNVCPTLYVQTITVQDSTAPVVTTLAGALDATLECSDAAGITAALALYPAATDNCTAVPTMHLVSDVTTPHATCANAYVQVRTWNFDDGCGNVSANYVQTITVQDNTAPVVTTLAGSLDATLECSDLSGITAALALYPAATDNCTAVPTMTLVSDVTTPHATCANAYIQVRTWNFDDGCGNVSANFVQTITVEDNTPPVVTTLAGALDATLECSDLAGITAALAMVPVATDNCAAVPTMTLVSDVTTPSTSCANAYVRVRTWSFDDGCGNVCATHFVQTITVEDNTAPVITTLAGALDATLECSDLTGIAAAVAMVPVATDNCSAVPNLNLISNVTTPSTTCANAYVQVRTWNFDDGCGNVSANFVQTITVQDNTAPVVTTLAGSLDATFECSNLSGITAALAMYPAATDNCTAVPTMTLVSNVTTPHATCANAYVQVRTWNFDDDCGNVSANFVQTITVQDNTAPVITTLAGALDVTLECSNTSGITAALALYPAATDNCTAVPTMTLVSDVTTPHATCANAYIQVRTWNFDDGCGNVSANYVQTITVEDNTPPVITTLAGALDATLECSDLSGITAALAMYPAATDNCTAVPTMNLVSDVTTPSAICANAYVRVRTWNFDDGCGNVCANFVQTITVEDNTAPVITTLAGALDATLECSNTTAIAAALAMVPVATDNCSAVPNLNLISDVTTPSATCANDYVRVRTWNFDDGCGNMTANFVQTITVEDNTAPVITTLAGALDATLECSDLSGIASALAMVPVATDNCSAVPNLNLISNVTTPSTTCANAYVQVRTWNFDDGCGNVSANFVQTITVEDNTAPVVTTLAGALDATFECSDLSGITAALALYPAATDNCTAVPTMTLVSNVTTPHATCANAYVQVRTWNFDDGCGNVSANFVQTITVQDNTAPVVTTLAGSLDATLECSDLSGITAALAMYPAATDNCTAVPTMTLVSNVTTPHATCANAYVQVRTWNFDDDCGNVSANFVQTITVQDNTAPVVTTLAGSLDATLECSNLSGITAALALYPAATDNCTAVPTMTLVSDVTTPSAICANAYIRVRTWNFDDGCGNVSANFVQTITVEDNTPPVITTLAGALDATLECSNTAGITAALALYPVATDNCTAVPTMTLVSDVTTPSATCANAYVRVRTWSFDDGCGNVCATYFVQTITVQDNTAPVITTLAGALDATLECSDLSGIAAAVAMVPVATDNCSAVPYLNLISDVTTPSATCANAYVQVRTWNFDDGCGNVSANFVQTITVEDNTAPVVMTVAGALDATLECSDATGIAAMLALVPSAIDNCTTVLNLNLVSNVTTPDPVCANAYIQVRTWNFDDGCGNVSANFVQTINVQDNTAPVVMNPLGALDATIECSDVNGLSTALAITPTAVDNCITVANLNLVSDVITGDPNCANSYTQVRTWNFDDGCGNVSANYVETITVQDNTAPVITTLAGGLDATLECSNLAGIAAALALYPAATDNCTASPYINILSDVTTPGANCTSAYVRVRSWNFDDGCGNVSATFVQTITVQDTQGPTWINLPPTNVVVDCATDPIPFWNPVLGIDYTDNCDPYPVLSTPISHDIVPQPDGTTWHTRSWKLMDNCLNASIVVTQTIVENRCQFASLTQGFYGNAGGRYCGNGYTTLNLLNSLLTTPLVVGIPGNAGSITFGVGQGDCIIQYLPGGGPSLVLPSNDYTFNSNCNMTPGNFPQVRNGRFRNSLLAQTVTFALNLRLDPYLTTDIKLPTTTAPYLWTLESNYVNGVCLDGDDTEIPGTMQSFLIPPSVITAMLTVFAPATDLYLSDLLTFANMALAGQNTYGASLSDIASALDAYNNGFDEARFFSGYHAAPPPKATVSEDVPEDFVLHQNHPNPFNPSTTITFTIPTDCSVRLAVYNALGVEVDVLVDRSVPAGTHSVTWNSSDVGAELPSGVYTYRIHAIGSDGKEYHDIRKMMLIR